MLMHKTCLLFVVPLLFTLPTGIAKAHDLDIQTGTIRVTIDPNQGIRIESANGNTLSMPSRSPMANPSWSRYPSPLPLPPVVPTPPSTRLYRSQPLSSSRCTGQSEQSDQSSHANGGVSQSSSAMSTRVCH